MKTTVSAITILVAMSAAANAACNVTQTGLTSHSESDCASAADVAAHGVTIADHEGRLVGLEGVTITQGNDIAALQGENAAQGLSITDHAGRLLTLEGTATHHGNRLDAVEQKNSDQDDALTDHESRLGAVETGKADKITSDGNSTTSIQAQGVIVEDVDGNKSGLAAEGLVVVDKDNPSTDGTIVTGKGVETTGEVTIKGTKVKETLDDHETRITTNKAKNDEQDGTLATHTSQIANYNTRIGSLETVTESHGARLNAHDAMLSQHAATLESYGDKLGDHDKLLAIAMAMPDAWLSDSKKFGIFGSVGGTESETALGFAAIGRIDETWSLNAKFGSDTEFKQFGWQVGAGAQW